jgi:filamentous hemagglutinin
VKNFDILAAQDSDYSLYDKKKKGSFGAKKTKRDEVTQVTNIGSEITSGGSMMLVSGGDQHYQVAKLDSGKDLTLNSGGGILFEGVKDLHQESHEKGNSNAAWNSMSGKGSTDETLRQSELLAKGNLVINAVDGLHIDVKQVNQQTVGEAIDAMVKADPNLAWLKDAEKRGDVDWRLVQEIHQSFKYSNSGLGVAAQLAIAILMAAIVGPAAAALAGGGTAGAMVGAVAAGASTNATVSFVNNGGNLGAVFKDVTSSDAIKGYLTSAATAGVASQLGYDPTKLSFDLASAQKVAINVVAQSFVKTVINGGNLGKTLTDGMLSAVIDIAGAIGAKELGGTTLADGSPTKVAAHALLGGLKSMAMGGDFQTGAIAGGANEALVQYLAKLVLPEGYNPDNPGMAQAQANLLAMTQLVAVLTTVVTGGDPGIAANIAANATQYNYLSHSDLERAANRLLGCGTDHDCAVAAYTEYRNLSIAQEKNAFIQCGQSPTLCADFSKIVAKAQADTALFRSMVDEAPDSTRELLNQLIAENDGFQNALAGVTAGHSADALAEYLAEKWGVSPEHLKEFTAGVILSVAAWSAVRAGLKAGNSNYPALDLVSGETKVVGGGKSAANDPVFDGAEAIGGVGKPLVSKGSEVTPDIIQKVLQGDPALSAQGGVSLPAVQRYVDRLLKGDVAPAIKMDGDVIVDGNHRYIAAKILGRNPDVTPGTLPPNKVGQTKPVSELKVDEVDWGNR